MTDQSYNYKQFDMAVYVNKALSGPEVGEPFGDFEVQTSEGEWLKFSQLLNKPVVIETGSVTCPIYASNVKKMQQLKQEFPDVQFVVLYVREAHPGTATPFHEDIEAKLEQAQRLKKEHSDDRLVLVDHINGSIHQKYGDLPNTVYFVNTDGTVLYRGNWNTPECLEKALKGFPNSLNELPDTLASPNPNPLLTIRVLLKGGWNALIHFFREMPKMVKEGKDKNNARVC